MRLSHCSFDDGVTLDFDTIKHLNLLELSMNEEDSNSLVGCLSRTFTDAGTRLLRSQLISPCGDLVTLRARVDVR